MTMHYIKHIKESYMGNKFRQFMQGRYGIMDELNKFLNILSLILVFLGIFTVFFVSLLGIVLFIFEYYRLFSRNTTKRVQENYSYLRFRNRIKGWFSSIIQRVKQSKNHHFYKCPDCKKTLRVPKGKGKISITCPHCNTKFVRKS